MAGGVDDIGSDLLHPAPYRASPSPGALPFWVALRTGVSFQSGARMTSSLP